MKSKSLILTVFTLFVLLYPNLTQAQEKLSDAEHKIKVISKKLNLDESERQQIRGKDTILSELYFSIEDSVETERVKSELDYFLAGKCNEKQLALVLKLERLNKGARVELNDNIDPDSAMHFDSVEDFMRWKAIFEKELEENVKTIVTKDSNPNI
ncbi:hypothetical protein DXT99_11385 [Pontibacter diazotrophicus]|uniref:Uncharacterized protein n=1 Tax=Pontibacter diazotrophicus TaxID=1400979 RepID=A0A3D8LD98_9BACT|nr:hypothetical protein [Pontibacter diazotrophicus]RDV15254.1 hypothetical protein DXT99_11385 [Pontibacter diazotrophicus]